MAPRSPRIGIVVTDAYAPEDPDHDTPLLLSALRTRGLDADPVVWHGDTDLASYDSLVIRSPWDYPDRADEFAQWLTRAAAASAVHNDPDVIRWNLDKQYLGELERAGVRVVPTAYCRTPAEAEAALAAHTGGTVVVKPTVSAGARDTGLLDAADPNARRLAERIIRDGGIAMVQPEIAELTAGAEKALYAIDGHFTHAIEKGPLLAHGGGLRGGVYVENPVPVEATEAERQFADDVLHAVVTVTGGPMPLYARIDTVQSAEHGLVLLEAELIEPALNLHVVPHVTELVADAIVRAAR